MNNKIIINIFIFVFFIGICFSIFNIIIWFIDNKNNSIIKEEVEEKIQIVENKEESSDSENNEESSDSENNEESLDSENKIDYIIDFDSLKGINPDTVGYIKVNNTNIDYIVVKGTDNKFYLNHNLKKEKNRSGWIFMDYRNKVDRNEKNTIIYGHNTNDGSMFGTLKNILNKDWYENEENHNVILVTETGQYTYKVFSTYTIEPENYYISTEFKNNNEFDNYVKTLKSRSKYNYDVDVSGEDNILTLSSCIESGLKRVVLHAKLIDEKKS